MKTKIFVFIVNLLKKSVIIDKQTDRLYIQYILRSKNAGTLIVGNNKFSTKVDLLNCKLLIQAKNILVILLSTPIKIWGKSVKRFMSYIA